MNKKILREKVWIFKIQKKKLVYKVFVFKISGEMIIAFYITWRICYLNHFQHFVLNWVKFYDNVCDNYGRRI